MGGWQTAMFSHLGTLLRGHDKHNQYLSEVYIILTSKRVVFLFVFSFLLKLFIFGEAYDQEDFCFVLFFYCCVSVSSIYSLFLQPSSHKAKKLGLREET